MKVNPVMAAGYMTRTKTGKGQRGFRPVQPPEPSLLFYMQSRLHALNNFLLSTSSQGFSPLFMSGKQNWYPHERRKAYNGDDS